MSGALAGRVALVTGAGSGIGRAAAIRLARDGAAVALVGRTAAKLHETREAIGNTDVELYPADVGDPTAIDALVAAALSRFLRLDIVPDTAQVFVDVIFERVDGVYNDGYADNIELVLTESAP